MWINSVGASRLDLDGHTRTQCIVAFTIVLIKSMQ